MSQSAPLRIDIISDVMCPWCIIGYKQLEHALQDTGTDYDLHWHPFELNPQMPPEGQNMREHIAEKYGSTPEQSQAAREKMTDMGTELGFEFRFSDDTRMHNTFNAHQLLHWAREQGRSHDLKQALLSAHFTHGRNVSDLAILAEIAGEIGLDRDEALAVLIDQRHADEVRAHEAFWLKQGIQGVPAIVFDSKYLVTGARGETRYRRLLESVLAENTPGGISWEA